MARILVADSGSSKTDWFLTDDTGNGIFFESTGLNPTFRSQAFIEDVLKKTFINNEKEIVEKVYFYGAGCSSAGEIGRVQNALDNFFRKSENYVSHDIEGSAIATCGDKEGIACILGTGSNACHWSGSEVLHQVPEFGMGYILGDDGSGSHLGKVLLRKFFYNEMPEDIRNELIKIGVNKAGVVEDVYGKQEANMYLAGYTRFIQEHISHPFIVEVVEHCFRIFFETHIVKYDKYKQLPANFVGSVAFIFQDQLRNVAKEFGVHIETIVKKPIENLVLFHLRKMKQGS